MEIKNHIEEIKIPQLGISIKGIKTENTYANVAEYITFMAAQKKFLNELCEEIGALKECTDLVTDNNTDLDFTSKAFDTLFKDLLSENKEPVEKKDCIPKGFSLKPVEESNCLAKGIKEIEDEEEIPGQLSFFNDFDPHVPF